MAELLARSIPAGERLFAQGDKGDCAYVVESGELEVLTDQNGVPHCVAVVGPGDLIGEMAIVDDAPRSASVIARTDARLIVIERQQVASRMAAADPVLRLLLNVVLNRLRGTLREPAGSTELHAPDEGAAQTDHDNAIERIKLENELQAALGAGEMQLFVQPIADMKTRRIAGFESLIRWKHPQRGMIPPDYFIKVAEGSGLIVAMGRWILRQACLAALRFENEDNSAGLKGRNSFISVNVSAGQFHDPQFVPALAEILRSTGIEPRRLKLEITESVLTDAAAAKRWIEECKALGVRIALDDFGTGYSSLSYLHDFAIDAVKVDQSFVRRMLSDRRSEKIVAAIIQLSLALDLEIIAEGIETDEHFERLASLGCQYAQGYLISKPVPVTSYFN
ncbi:MAG: EAL domain-containing protein [Nevskia sp.]|nr:EAL domain-containing protein [Nevskia sp.]